MTGEEMERAIEFLLKSQAELTDAQTQTSRDVAALASQVGELTGVVVGLADVAARLETEAEGDRREMRAGFERIAERMDRFEAQAESDRQEIREAINNLIIANEVTRKLSEDVARIALDTKQRVTDLESRLP